MESELGRLRLSLPSYADQHGAMQALIRLHRVYHLSTSDLADGYIHGYEGEPLNNKHLYHLAVLSKQNHNYRLAEECLLIILDRNATDVSIVDISLELAHIYDLVRVENLCLNIRVVVQWGEIYCT